jgi:hypothetical protein
VHWPCIPGGLWRRWGRRRRGAYAPESNTTLAIYVEALQALAHDVTQWMQRAATHTGARYDLDMRRWRLRQRGLD